MKLSCLPVSFFDEIISRRMSVGEWARMGCELGLDAVDLSILFVPDRSAAGVAALRKQIESEGMHVAMITSYPDFTHPDAAQRARELDLETQAIEVAHDMGARMVRVTAGQAHPQTRREEGICWAIDGLSKLTERVRTLDVQLVYENHAKPGAWQYADFSQPPEIFLEIVRQTADFALGINFDTGNAASFAADPVGLLEVVIERERLRQLVVAHHGERGAVDVTELLVAISLEDAPGIILIVRRHADHGEDATSHEAVPERDGRSMPKAHPKERQRLPHHKVGRQQRRAGVGG
jgi:sugar phosphate isomerase/epimerase